jgi:ABC-2 type transport system permease protein
MQLVKLLNADCKKTKHTSLLLMHLVIPLIGAVAMVFYDSLSHSAYSVSHVAGYLQLLAIAFPLLIGVICSLNIDQESQAGNFQVLFTSSNPKYLALLSKFIFLMLLGFGAALLAVYSYVAGISATLHKNLFPWSFYLTAILIIVASFVFDYIFHLFLSLRFGKGASIGVGIVELLLAAIFNTDLGDKIWVAFPCTWGIRFVTTWTNYASKSDLQSSKYMMAVQSSAELNAGIMICIIVTVLSIIFACIWFSHWEGKRSED